MPTATELLTETHIFYSIEPFQIAHGQPLNHTLHRHSETTELLLVLEGTVRCQMEGRIYTAPAGSVLVIPQGTWHELAAAAREQQSGYRLSFKVDPLLQPALSAECPPITLTSDLHGIKALFVRLEQEKKKANLSGPVAYHLIGLILALVSHGPATSLPSALSNEAMTVQEIKYYMEENHGRSVTLEDLAQHFNMNKYQLARTFKQYIGIPPLQYLISCRLDAAKHLLAATNHPAAAIARAIGYKSVTQFQAAFKKAIGSTPRQYRLAQQSADRTSE